MSTKSSSPDDSRSYGLVIQFFTILRKIFFRDVIIRGSHNIPSSGPVIFVAAPHANQFVDPMILSSTCARTISFLIAKVSLKRRIIGSLGRMMHSIPVERIQDYARKCDGSIRLSTADDLIVVGEGTHFLSQLNLKPAQDLQPEIKVLIISFDGEQFTAPIAHIIDNTQLQLAKPFDHRAGIMLRAASLAFSVAPFIDQNIMYSSAFHALQAGKAIGIFPEGGSHDRAEMLPLKAGVSIMALGFQSMSRHVPLKIIPCGLNYFHADKFRSRAVIEYGEPLLIPTEILDKFELGGSEKKVAISELLRLISASLYAVTVNVPDYETLQIIQAARRLYRPPQTIKRPDLQLELSRRFVKGYLKYADDPRVVQLKNSILAYNSLLTAFGIRDHLVMSTDLNVHMTIIRLFYHLAVLVVFGLISLPGFLINGPALIAISRISKRKAAAAKKASSVKILGRDVISTWKLLVALIVLPSVYSFYGVLLTFWFFSHAPILDQAVIYFCLFSAIMATSYMTIRLSELFMDSYHSVKPLIMALLNPRRLSTLQQVRRTLRDQINLIVEEFGPNVVDNFDRNRLVKSSEDLRPTSPRSFYQSTLGSVSQACLSSSGDSGRSSPIFDINMESLENMLRFCQDECLSVKKEK